MTLMSSLQQGLSSTHQAKDQNSRYTRRFYDYVHKLKEMVGLGYSTTCAYQYVFHPDVFQETIIIIQFLVMAGLGSTCPIEHQAGLNFRADTFSHYTSMPLIIQDGMVHWVSIGSVSIVAVGNWYRSVESYEVGSPALNVPTPSVEDVASVPKADDVALGKINSQKERTDLTSIDRLQETAVGSNLNIEDSQKPAAVALNTFKVGTQVIHLLGKGGAETVVNSNVNIEGSKKPAARLAGALNTIKVGTEVIDLLGKGKVLWYPRGWRQFHSPTYQTFVFYVP
jgi:hypothetical protein